LFNNKLYSVCYYYVGIAGFAARGKKPITQKINSSCHIIVFEGSVEDRVFSVLWQHRHSGVYVWELYDGKGLWYRRVL